VLFELERGLKKGFAGIVFNYIYRIECLNLHPRQTW
jgi:hypothetical protein